MLASELTPATHAGLTVNVGAAERGGQGRSSGVLTRPDHVFLALDLTHPQPGAPGGRAHTASPPQAVQTKRRLSVVGLAASEGEGRS